MRLQIVVVSLCLLAIAIPVQPAVAAGDESGPSLDPIERATIKAVNRERRRHGLRRLRIDPALSTGADAHSADMLLGNYFGHDSPGLAWSDRIRAYRPSRQVGEVLGRWYPGGTPASTSREALRIVRAWMGSPPHRSTILTRGFQRIGAGRRPGALGGREVALYTVDLASRR